MLWSWLTQKMEVLECSGGTLYSGHDSGEKRTTVRYEMQTPLSSEELWEFLSFTKQEAQCQSKSPQAQSIEFSNVSWWKVKVLVSPVMSNFFRAP